MLARTIHPKSSTHGNSTSFALNFDDVRQYYDLAHAQELLRVGCLKWGYPASYQDDIIYDVFKEGMHTRTCTCAHIRTYVR